MPPTVPVGCLRYYPIFHPYFCYMAVIQEFEATRPKETFRLEKSVQHLTVRRKSFLSILGMGIVAALPEVISSEVTNTLRKRIQPLDRIPLADVAAWAQFGRGPIVEKADFQALLDNGFGLGVAAGVDPESGRPLTSLVETKVNYYLGQNGPLEVLADDHYMITIENLVPGAHYTIEAPEVPLIPQFTSQYYAYERGIILENDRERDLHVTGRKGIVFPNNPGVIERVLITYDLGNGQTSQCEYSLSELLDTQSEANPFVAVMSYRGATAAQRTTSLLPSSDSDLLVVSFGSIVRFEIHTVLGHQLQYTLVSSLDRNQA